MPDPTLCSPVVAASVLCSAVHLMAHNVDIIKRWVNEVQEAVQVRRSCAGAGPAFERFCLQRLRPCDWVLGSGGNLPGGQCARPPPLQLQPARYRAGLAP